jgi:hypothetical protein
VKLELPYRSRLIRYTRRFYYVVSVDAGKIWVRIKIGQKLIKSLKIWVIFGSLKNNFDNF